jgi:hypothetical protein
MVPQTMSGVKQSVASDDVSGIAILSHKLSEAITRASTIVKND